MTRGIKAGVAVPAADAATDAGRAMADAGAEPARKARKGLAASRWRIAILTAILIGGIIYVLIDRGVFEDTPPAPDPTDKVAYARAMFDMHCGTCHRTMGNYDTIRRSAEAGEGGMPAYLRQVAEAGFMAPSPWHRDQLLKNLDRKGLGS